MVNKFTLVALLVFFISLSYAEEVVPEKSVETEPEIIEDEKPATPKESIEEKNITFSAGFGHRKTKWKHSEDADNTNTTYNIKDADYNIVEGDIIIPKFSTKLGFNFHKESGGLSQAQQFAGYVGFSNTIIKSESGRFAGNAYFAGNITAEQTRNVSFENKYRYTEIDYEFSVDTTPWYLGIRYTVWKLPTELALLGPGETSGPTVFDPEFEAKFYSLIFGMDFLKRDILPSQEFASGWGVMFSFYGGVGFGTSTYGDKAIRATETIYNKKMTDTSPGVFVIHTSGQIGPKYRFKFKYLRLVVGLGYDWNLLMLLNMAPKATVSSEVQPVAYPNFLYHGPILRLHGTF